MTTLTPHTVRQYMTATPETVDLSTSVAEALDTMERLKIRHLPVVENDALVGIVSERDLCIAKTARGIDPEDIGVGEVMTRDVYTVDPDSPIEAAAARMIEGRFGSSLVVFRGQVVGIFTTTDALRALIEFRVTDRGAEA